MRKPKEWPKNLTKINEGIFRTIKGNSDEMIGVGRCMKAGFPCSRADVTNGRYVLDISGGATNCTIQNCTANFTWSGSNQSSIDITNGASGLTTANILVQNCVVGDATNLPWTGFYIKGYSISAPTGVITVRNNTVYASETGISFYQASSGTSEISYNKLYVGTPTNNSWYCEAIYLRQAQGTVNIFGNQVLKLETGVTGLATVGIIGVAVYSGANAGTVVNIYNNFITGIKCSVSYISPIYGIWCEEGDAGTAGVFGATTNIWDNTILLNPIAGTVTAEATCIGRLPNSPTTQSITMKNNILVNTIGTAKSYAVYMPSSTASPVLTSDYNDLYVTGTNVGNWNGTDETTLSSWQVASGKDANSKSVAVTFASNVSPFNLHLAGASTTDANLHGTTTAYTLDIDGDTRGATPFMGADEPQVLTLNLTAFVEAMLVAGGGTTMTMAPSVTVELHDAGTLAVVESSTATLSTAGVGTFGFGSVVNGTPYYIVVKSLNTVETWSATAHSFSAGSLTYNFSTALGQAYTDGSNPPLALHSGKYCIYSGDVNQDGYVTGDDYTGVDNDNTNFAYHLVNDVNGDGYVTGDDYTFIDNNNTLFIQRQVPPGAPSHLVKRVIKNQINSEIKSQVHQKSSVN